MIPFIDLGAQQKKIYDRIEIRIREVLSHGQYIMGHEVGELEDKLRKYAEIKHVFACSSGTDALLMPLMAYGIGKGDAVFTTPFTFIATAEVIALLGATPVFVDIDSRTFNIDPAKLKLAVKAVKENDPSIYPLPRDLNPQPTTPSSQLLPKGIIAVDLFGLPADYERINAIAEDQRLFVLEDAAQSFGGSYHGKKAGSLADVAATSFFPAKPLGCYGDGGAVLTNNDDLAAEIESIRVHGKGKDKYDNTRIGINGRLDTIQAAILLEKLAIFPDEIEERNRIAKRYSIGLEESVQVPYVPSGSISVWAQYSIVSDACEEIRQSLQKADIPTAVYYPRPLHLQGAFSGLGYRPGDFPIAEETSQKIFSLPMHPYLKDEHVERIIKIIKSHRGHYRSGHRNIDNISAL
ncbi:MAG: DegT/DnrJ/EryC1/StrS family aminotransferase [Thermodesulfobacteriota bacterium]|nr:DegT/DnrJ/EryC1/StrS family aminotransferase [Thermodesulfobacteriota bacterium]